MIQLNLVVILTSIQQNLTNDLVEIIKSDDIKIQMISCIDQLQVLINERLDHLQMLLLDSNQLSIILKDDQKKRAVVKNFRIIKAAQKTRTNLEHKELLTLSKLNRKMTKHEIIVCENMFANCMNQYLNTEYESKNSGEVKDIIEAFIFYYQNINAHTRLNQLKVVKNCGLFYQTNFMYENMSFFISNIQQSLNHVYQRKKTHFFNCLKNQSRNISPQKRGPDEEQIDKLERFDKTGISFSKKKKNLQLYCFELSKILQLEHVSIDYFYFSAMDFQRRKKILESNFIKRNLHILRQIGEYDKNFQLFKLRKFNSEQMGAKNKLKQSVSLMEKSTQNGSR